MKGSRFSEEQIIGVLREHEAGAKTEEVCRRKRALGTRTPMLVPHATNQR